MVLEKVVIAFVTESSNLTEQHWLNTWAAALAPAATESDKIIHCECFFPRTTANHMSNRTGKAYGIYYGGPVWHHDRKKYSNTDYIFKTIMLKKAQKRKMITFLDGQVGKGFNHLGYASFMTPCNISGNMPGFARRFYCSQLTMAALNHSGIFGECDLPENVHPHRVFDLLTEYSTASRHPVRQVDYAELTF